MAVGGEFGDAGLGAVAEAEVAALVEGEDAEAALEDLLDEVEGGEVGERGVEGQDEGGVDAGGGEEAEALGDEGEQAGSLGRAEESLGVGIEGDGDGAGVAVARVGQRCGEQMLVAAVDAVEVADDGDGGAEVGGQLGERAVDLHPASLTGTVRPSWASWRCGGSCWLVA